MSEKQVWAFMEHEILEILCQWIVENNEYVKAVPLETAKIDFIVTQDFGKGKQTAAKVTVEPIT